MASYLSSLLGRSSKPTLDVPGKWQLQEFAGYNVILIAGKDDKIRAFVNACRHRAFPVLHPKVDADGNKTSIGKSQIIACGYHGWAYNPNGALVKAPQFDKLEGFDKAEHGLLELPVHRSEHGFIFFSLNPNPGPWKEQFGDLDEQQRLKDFRFDQYKYELSWSMEHMPYNWKVLVDNYSECHHCSYTHPGFVDTCHLNTYRVVGDKGTMGHYVDAKDKALAPGQDKENAFAFNLMMPHGSMTLSSQLFYVMRILPQSARTCSIHFDVFRHEDCTDEQFKEAFDFFQQVETEDKDLCAGTQKGLEMGTYTSGTLHPERESGVIYWQKRHIELLQQHFKEEQVAGHEINLAARPYKGSSTDADQFLSELEGCAGSCGSGGKENEW
ncbi:hypothetical protein JCM10213_008242 [Rhodosporidiobolus nylandii]